jgi:hypothetical protein
MNNLGLCHVVQLGLAFGMAGLLWPDRLMPLFETLMFPWAASCRAIRAKGIAATKFCDANPRTNPQQIWERQHEGRYQ